MTHERAAELVAHLERKTVANGCTEAEAQAARAKALHLRERFQLKEGGGRSPLSAPAFVPWTSWEAFMILHQAITMTVYYQAAKDRRKRRRRRRK